MEHEYVLDRTPEKNSRYLKERMVCAVTGEEVEMEYVEGRKIGSGTFGLVFLIILGGVSGYALKRVFEKKSYMNRELEILKNISHPSIVKMFWYFYGTRTEEGVYLNIIMEYVKTDVYTFIKNREYVGRDDYIAYAVQLLDGLSYLHSKGIAHRDIKPSNILIDEKEKILKICDLGSAKMIVNAENNVIYICSRYYRAPEIHLGKEYDLKIDVWSAGCVLFEMVTHQILFGGESAEACLARIRYVLKHRTLSYLMEKASRHDLLDCLDIIEKMLSFDPETRISAEDALMQFKSLQTKQNEWV
ncbi:glycogen synthase kinase 3 beta [Nematocida minor]|uniref:glycogen synthase kinase 3 beta n=1 Tax=Nematocida minor TaxID=1912983 RepID=UPI00221FE288|nr:glycogen synthase kinase 3 beta [Nematocida minor]KAI5192507.1 glycogen synthase kinase 3 beta [Nematocida minor]